MPILLARAAIVGGFGVGVNVGVLVGVGRGVNVDVAVAVGLGKVVASIPQAERASPVEAAPASLRKSLRDSLFFLI